MNEKQPFQFQLKSLFWVIVLICMALAAWRWLPVELWLFTLVPVIVAVGVTAIVFLQAAMFWLVVEAASRLKRMLKRP